MPVCIFPEFSNPRVRRRRRCHGHSRACISAGRYQCYNYIWHNQHQKHRHRKRYYNLFHATALLLPNTQIRHSKYIIRFIIYGFCVAYYKKGAKAMLLHLSALLINHFQSLTSPLSVLSAFSLPSLTLLKISINSSPVMVSLSIRNSEISSSASRLSRSSSFAFS